MDVLFYDQIRPYQASVQQVDDDFLIVRHMTVLGDELSIDHGRL